MKPNLQSLVLALLAINATAAQAQQRPPVRKIGAVSAKTAETFTNVSGVRSLSDGSVLVNDVPNRRVLLFNPQLSTFTVVADSTSATDNAYGGRTGSLVAYRGDSSIFIDPASVSMLVIDPAGKVARVMAIPRAEDAMILGSGLGNPVFDGSGRLIYRAGAGFGMRSVGAGGNVRITQGPPGGAAGGRPPAMAPPEIPDSAFVVSVDLATRKVDTLGYIRTPKTKFEINHDANGGMRMQSMINPLPVVDDWSVLPDGSIAFVRGKDYHIDWVTRDGARTSSSKIPFNWQRLTEEDKVEFLDSLKAARARLGPNAPVPGAPGSAPGAQAAQVMVFSQTMGGGGGGAQPAPTRTMTRTEPSYVAASELPDYKPAFFAGSTIADNEGNLWVRTIPTEAIAGGPVYDVINRKGELVERVQIPENRTVVAFGRGGAVYMLNREGATATLEKASIR